MNDPESSPVDIPGYKIIEELGSGGMSTVYLAEEVDLGRKVALKVLSAELSNAADFKQRFLAEGRTAANLHHSNIVTIYNMGIAGDIYFIAMEYIDGDSLSQHIVRGIAIKDVIQTTRRIAEALGFAHNRKVLHRDVKPSNILFRDNQLAVLADFGIAKTLESDITLTQVGTVLGTPKYMSPEQARGEKIDHRSDLYSLGVVLFEMLTSKAPYDGDSPIATAVKHTTEPIPKLPQQLQYLQPIIDCILAKSSEDRFQTAEQFIESLDKIVGDRVVDIQSQPTMVIDPAQLQLETLDSPPSLPSKIAVQPGKTGPTAKFIGWIRSSPQAKRYWATASITLVLATIVLFAIGTFIEWKTERNFQRRVKVHELLVQAKVHLGASRYIEPEGNNGAETYRNILELDSENDSAIQGLATIEKHLEKRVSDVRSGDGSKKALMLVEKALLAFPDSPTLIRMRTNFKQEIEDQERQVQIAELIKKSKDQESALHLSEPEDDNAFTTFQEILRLDPGNAEAQRGLSRIADIFKNWARDSEKAGDLSKALDRAEQGLRIMPENPELITLRSRIRQEFDLKNQIEASLTEAAHYIAQGRLFNPEKQNAFAVVSSILELDKKNPTALELKRKIEVLYVDQVTQVFQQGTLRRGLEMVNGGIAVFPGQKNLLKLRGNIQAQLALEAQLQSAQQHLATGWLIEPAGENAREIYREILKKNPDNQAAAEGLRQITKHFVALASDKNSSGNFQQALEATQLGLQTDSANPTLIALQDELKQRLAVDATTERLLNQARQRFREGTLIEPRQQSAYASLKEIFRLDRENGKAKAIYTELANRVKENIEKESQQGRNDSALVMAEKGRELFPEFPAFSDLSNGLRKRVKIDQLAERAKAQRHAGRLLAPDGDNAAQSLKEILELEPDNTAALTELREIAVVFLDRAQAFAKKGDASQAKKAILQGLRVDPKQAGLRTLQSTLARKEQQPRQSVEQQDAGQAVRIKTLVDRARKALAANRLTSPKQDNVVIYVRELLAYNPNHSEARRILAAVIARYIGIADRALARGNLPGARRAESKAKRLTTEFNLADAKVQRLRKRIDVKQKQRIVNEKKRKQAQSLAKAAEEKTKARSRSQINSLLDKARKALQANRLTNPKGDNAVEYAAQVLKMKPGHKGARGVLQGIVGRYVALGEVALNREQIDQARDYQRTAERLVKSYRLADAELKNLGARLAAKRSQLELDKARDSAELPSSAADDGRQEREDEIKRLREQLEEATRIKSKQAPKQKRKEVFLPPAL